MIYSRKISNHKAVALNVDFKNRKRIWIDVDLTWGKQDHNWQCNFKFSIPFLDIDFSIYDVRHVENDDWEIYQERFHENLANLCHKQWSGWMEYLFSKGIFHSDGTWIMPKWAVERWERQMRTEYIDLSESEQGSDRKEAAKFIQVFDNMEL